MARSKHRKKHKSHVQEFKKERSHDTKIFRRGSSFPVFTIIGGLFGAIVAYIPTNGTLLWVGIGLVVGAIAGYLLGQKVDAGK